MPADRDESVSSVEPEPEPSPEAPQEPEGAEPAEGMALAPIDLLARFETLYDRVAKAEAEAAESKKEADMLRAELARERRSWWDKLRGR